MEQILKELVVVAGPVAAGIGLVLVIIILGLKYSGVGLAIGSKTKLVDDDKLSAVTEKLAGIGTKVDSIETRLGTVEHDVTTRATREEVHRLELAFTRMEGRFDSVSATTQATANAISRIEDYMYTAAMNGRKGGRDV